MTSIAFDGEAPETDDEIEKEEEKLVKKEEKRPPIAQTPIDKNLKKRWTQVATETIHFCQKRSQNHERTMQKMTESAENCFTSIQNVAAKLNNVTVNVARLEDSVADLVEASQLIPKQFPAFDLNIPEFL